MAAFSLLVTYSRPACEKLVVHMRSEVDRLAERDAVWAKRDAEMKAALKAAERQLVELNAAGTVPAAAEVCSDSTLWCPSFNLTPIEHLLPRDIHPDVPRPVGAQALDLASLRVSCTRAECEMTALSAKADAAHSAAAAAEAARHALALEVGEVRRREAELLRENARLAGEYRFGWGPGVAGVTW